MDKISKFLKKLSKDSRCRLEQLISQILIGDLSGLDVKKLKGEINLFRVRKGDLRIIFLKTKDTVRIIDIDRRNDTTYNF